MTLDEHPVPPLAEITAAPGFAPVLISRAEFETVWDKAYSDDDEPTRLP
jgi:hypothetical protein